MTESPWRDEAPDWPDEPTGIAGLALPVPRPVEPPVAAGLTFAVVPYEASWAIIWREDGTIEPLDVAEDETLAAWLLAYKDQAERAVQAKKAVDAEVTRRIDRTGKRHVDLAGLPVGTVRLKVPAPPGPEYDPKALRDHLEKLAADDVIDQESVDLVVPLVPAKVYTRPLDILLSALDEEHAEAIRKLAKPSNRSRGSVTVETS